ncbi:hypothetical protein [Methylobacillus sp.]|uniref:hypothetical protein n=1 Tax=Methylobacillus sp. TaxID=56818 RepID=UPI002FE28119
MNKTTAKILLLIGASLIVAGCGTPGDKKIGLAQKWAEKIREYQVQPIFPPREDFQVGDIILVCEIESDQDRKEKNPNEWLPIPLMINRLNVNQELQGFYKKSVAMPVDEQEGNNKGKGLPKSDNIFSGNQNIKALKQVAFPDFAAVTVTGVGAGAALPSGIMLSKFGLSKQDVNKVSMSVPSAVSYQLPWQEMKEIFFKQYSAESDWKKLQTLKNDYQKNCKEPKSGSKLEAKIMVVGEIYAAYAITTEIGAKKAISGNLESRVVYDPESTKQKIADLLKSEPGADNGENSQLSQPDKNTVATDANPKPEPEKVQALYKLFDEQLAKADQAGKPQDLDFAGVRIKSYLGSTSSITIDQTFSSPVVVGYRGYEFKFDGKTPELTSDDGTMTAPASEEAVTE